MGIVIRTEFRAITEYAKSSPFIAPEALGNCGQVEDFLRCLLRGDAYDDKFD